MTLKSKLSLLVIFALLVSAFQNCQKSSLLSFSEKSLSSMLILANNSVCGGGNGDPYGGKIYLYVPPGFACTNTNGQNSIAFQEKIDIVDGRILHSKNDCWRTTVQEIDEKQLTIANNFVQFQDRLFQKSGSDIEQYLSNLIDPNFRWVEHECVSTRTPEMIKNNILYSVQTTTNYNGDRSFKIVKSTIAPTTTIYELERPAVYNNYGHTRQWTSSDDISVSVFDALKIGEAHLFEDGQLVSLGLDCQIK